MEDVIVEGPVDRREARKQDRRQAIVAAARESFLQQGYAATSMSGLLKTLGGSKATLWGYFRSKEVLFAAVIEDVASAFRQQLQGDLSAPGDIGTVLTAFCTSFMSKIVDPDSLAVWRLVVAESGRFPEVGKIFYEQGVEPTRQVLADFLARHIATQDLREDDPIVMAEVLMNMCCNKQDKLLWGVETFDQDSIDRDAKKFADYFLMIFLNR